MCKAGTGTASVAGAGPRQGRVGQHRRGGLSPPSRHLDPALGTRSSQAAPSRRGTRESGGPSPTPGVRGRRPREDRQSRMRPRPWAGRGGKGLPPAPPAPWPGVAAPRLHPECATVCFHAAFVACLVLRYCGPSEVMRMRCQVPEGSTVRGFTSVRPALSRNAPIRDRPARGLWPRWSWGSRPARWGPQAGPACRQHPLQPGLRL